MDLEQLNFSLRELREYQNILQTEVKLYTIGVNSGRIQQDPIIELEFEEQSRALIEVFDYYKSVRDNLLRYN